MQFFAHLTIAGQYRLSAWQSPLRHGFVVAFALVAVGLCLAGIYAVNSSSSRAGSTNSHPRRARGHVAGHPRPRPARQPAPHPRRPRRRGIAGLRRSRGLANLLYGVPALDAAVYFGAALLMTAACVGATFLPARRAARVDPLTALRAE